jgi:hypothetical protein
MDNDNRKVLMTSSTIIIGTTHIVKDSNSRLDEEVTDFAHELHRLIHRMSEDEMAHAELMRIIKPLVEIKEAIELLKTEMLNVETKCVDILTKIARSYDDRDSRNELNDLEPTLGDSVETIQDLYDDMMGPLFDDLIHGADSLEAIDYVYRDMIQSAAHSIGRENVTLSREALATAVVMARVVDELAEEQFQLPVESR